MCTGTHTCATGTVCTHYSSAATALNSGNLATLRSSVSFVTGSIISLQHEKTSAIKKQNGIRTWNTLTEKKHEAAQSKLKSPITYLCATATMAFPVDSLVACITPNSSSAVDNRYDRLSPKEITLHFTISPGKKESDMLIKSISFSLTSCFCIIPSTVRRKTCSRTQKICTLAYASAIRITLHKTTSLTSGKMILWPRWLTTVTVVMLPDEMSCLFPYMDDVMWLPWT